ncbi:MAG TPA: SH3 domain-containing protein, partial [Caldilineaceae bacterium]|nr:SH3 domain-containing protein [Caldilineaceae bacterium]
MKSIAIALFLCLGLLAACAPEMGAHPPSGLASALPSTPPPAAPQPSATAGPGAGETLAGLLLSPGPTPGPARRPVKPAPPLPGMPDLLPTTTPTPATGGLAALRPTPTPRGARPLIPVRTPKQIPGAVGSVTVNVRGGPGTHYPVVGKVSNGAQFDIVGRTETGDWLRVCCPVGGQTESWISAEFVTPEPAMGEALADLPIPDIPPAPAESAGGGGGNRSAAELAAAPAPDLPG